MPSLHDDVLDNGLAELDVDADELHILSAEPTVYADIATNTLGNKTSPTVSPPADKAGGGREVTVSSFTDGNVTATGTATHWALVDSVGSRLLATAALSASQAVTNGNTFSLGSFTVGIPDPA